MPLTARNYAQGVRFLTYYDGEQVSLNWKDLADTQDTLVFYMSGKSLPDLVKNLNKYAQIDKPLEIIEQATTPQEHVLTSTLFLFEGELSQVIINPPALVVIGEVVRLYQKPSSINQSTISFFKEHPYAG
jgi:siroheme synthase